MNGAGNDFVVIDGRGLDLDLSALAKRACALKGADGFMALDDSDVADFRLHFYNADGSRGEMCGNGARCICRFGCELGVAGPEILWSMVFVFPVYALFLWVFRRVPKKTVL